MDAALERILAPDYLGDVARRPLPEIRSLRAECQRVESQLSYLRRMVQGRHDIVHGELERRGNGGDRSDLADLVRRLPQILADSHSRGGSRVSQTFAPGELSGRLANRLDGIVTEGHLTTLGDTDDAELAAIAADLELLEHEVSDVRRALFGRIDALQGELTRRYRDGEADVEELLRE